MQKPYQVEIVYTKNVSNPHSPPRYEEHSRFVTVWANNLQAAMAIATGRYNTTIGTITCLWNDKKA